MYIDTFILKEGRSPANVCLSQIKVIKLRAKTNHLNRGAFSMIKQNPEYQYGEIKRFKSKPKK